MIILALESSCDETSAAVVKNGVEVLSHAVYSQIPLHAKIGGVVPEVAAREHVVKVLPIIQKALDDAHITPHEISAIAVTAGPGLITSLLVGVDTARTLAYLWKKPLIPVNHLDGHLAAAGIKKLHTASEIKTFRVQEKYPRVLLLVSGGHTQLFVEPKKGRRRMLGETIDDAAGEAFDKAAMVMNLPYPGGPSLSALAKSGNREAFNLPRPLSKQDNYTFSFSGLKTAFIDLLTSIPKRKRILQKTRADLAASYEQAIVDSLWIKTEKAIRKFHARQVVIAGGVAANSHLREYFTKQLKKHHATLLVPDFSLCTDNAAMIGAQAFLQRKKNQARDPRELEADTSFAIAK
jgi:N6-L-threonylcarbamoyladenine synthase